MFYCTLFCNIITDIFHYSVITLSILANFEQINAIESFNLPVLLEISLCFFKGFSSKGSSHQPDSKSLWSYQAEKADALIKEFGLTPSGHLYRVKSKTAQLINGKLSADTFDAKFNEVKFEQFMERIIKNNPFLAKLEALPVISGYSIGNDSGLEESLTLDLRAIKHAKVSEFNRKLEANHNTCIYFLFTRFGELLVVGETSRATKRCKHYRQLNNPQLSTACKKAFRYYGNANIFCMCLMLDPLLFDRNQRKAIETAFIDSLIPSCNVMSKVGGGYDNFDRSRDIAGNLVYFLDETETIIYKSISMIAVTSLLKVAARTLHNHLNGPNKLFNVVYIKDASNVTQLQINSAKLISEADFLVWFKTHADFKLFNLQGIRNKARTKKVKIFDIKVQSAVSAPVTQLIGVFDNINDAAAHIQKLTGQGSVSHLRKKIKDQRLFLDRFIITYIEEV